MADIKLALTCEQFEAAVSDYVDGSLSAVDRSAMDAHSAGCLACSALVADVESIVHAAASLPPLVPSHDLWHGIEERLDTPVFSIETVATAVPGRSRVVSLRTLAAAAALLVTASSSITWWLARGNPVATASAPAHPVASLPPVGPTIAAPAPDSALAPANVVPARATVAASDNREPRAHYASAGNGGVEFVYEREINAIGRIVDERLVDLDSTTVVEIHRNLRIIDKAINDSRRALENDPHSRFLATQLDRALVNKLEVLRRIALL